MLVRATLGDARVGRAPGDPSPAPGTSQPGSPNPPLPTPIFMRHAVTSGRVPGPLGSQPGLLGPLRQALRVRRAWSQGLLVIVHSPGQVTCPLARGLHVGVTCSPHQVGGADMCSVQMG